MLLAREDSGSEQFPFPGAKVTVRATANVRTEGEYYLEASLPKIVDDTTLTDDTILCALTVSITRDNKPVINDEVTALSSFALYGFANIESYKSGKTWHLTPGEYTLEVKSHGNCDAAMSRGAILSLEQQVTHITERFLGNMLRYYAGILFLCAGWLGLVFSEVRDAIRRRERL